MINLNADITINKNGGEITEAQSTIENMDFSANINDIINNKTKQISSSPFIFGRSILGKGDTFSGKVKYFVGKEFSSLAYGNFANPYQITVYGQNITSVSFVFDTFNNEYPRSIHLDEKIKSGVDSESIEYTTGTELVPVDGMNRYYASVKKTYPFEIVSFRIFTKSDNIEKTEIKIKHDDNHTISGLIYSRQSNQKVWIRLWITYKLTSGEIVCESPYVTIDDLPGNSVASFIIDNWNLPNRPLKLQGIYINNKIQIDSSNIISYEDSLTDRARIDAPSYGVVSTSGRLSFIDYNNDVKSLAERNLLVSGIEMTASVVENVSQTSEKLATLYTDKWNYNSNNKVVEVTLKDPLEKMQEIYVEGFGLNPLDFLAQSGKFIFDYLQSQTIIHGIPIVTFDELSDKIKNRLETLTIDYPYLKEGVLWAKWNNLCEAVQMHLFWDIDKINFTYFEGD